MRIVDIGAMFIDYTYDVKEFVQAGQTIQSLGRSMNAGGKGLNQSIALGRAGADVSLVGIIGKEGAFLRDQVGEAGVDTRWVRVADVPNGHTIIQRNAQGENCIILSGGASLTFEGSFVDEVLDSFAPGDWVLLQNEVNCTAHAIEAAGERDMRVVLNPSPADEALLSCPLEKVDCFILNEGEAAELSGHGPGGADELLAAMRGRFPGAEIVLTLGGDGSMVACENEVVRQQAFTVSVVDTTGAGDTFTGYYLAERARGSTLGRALEVASAASAIAVTRAGAAPSIPTMAEVEEFLADRGR